MPRRRSNAPGPAPEVIAPMQAKRNRAPRRKAVPGHRGIYYRPRPDGKIAPPYEIFYVDCTGKHRTTANDGTLEDAAARRVTIRDRPPHAERLGPTSKTIQHNARA